MQASEPGFTKPIAIKAWACTFGKRAVNGVEITLRDLTCVQKWTEGVERQPDRTLEVSRRQEIMGDG